MGNPAWAVTCYRPMARIPLTNRPDGGCVAIPDSFKQAILKQAILTCDNSPYSFKGAPAARRAWRPSPGSRVVLPVMIRQGCERASPDQPG